MDQQEMSFVMHTPEGDITMQVLFTFFSEETKANYILFTPDDLDSGKPPRLSAARYDPEDMTRIMPLQGDMDRDVVQSFINYISSTPRDEVEKTVSIL
ncbi:MAG: hypothetical protein J6C98_03445 [Oscillospiraceae bacterium]|nr:hypothetical protein [Oscillospiraceae bacterium]